VRKNLLFAAAAVLAWPTRAAAQPTPTSAGTPADIEVEVWGERPGDLTKSGASVSVVTRETIESLPGGGTQPLTYVLASQPGFVTDTFGFGFHARAADGGMLYVLDGIPLLAAPLGQFGSAGGFFPMGLIDSMRIITGGFAAEYGYGLGAVVDITMRRAVGGPSGVVQLTAGSYGLWDAAMYYAQQVGKLGVFVAGNVHTTDRGIDPPAVSPILHDAMTTGSAFARADYALDSHERVELVGTYSQTRYQIPIDPTIVPLSQAPAGATRGPDSYGNLPPPFVPYNANPLEDERNVFVALSYIRKDGNDRFQVTPYVRESYGKLSCDPNGSLGPTADPGSTCSDVERDAVHFGGLADVTWGDRKTQAWKAGVVADVTPSHVDYTSYTRNDNSPAGGPDPALTLSGHDDTTVVMAGAYIQDKISIGRLTVFPGLRLDIENADYNESGVSPLVLVGPSARLGISYSLTDTIEAHAYAGYIWQPPNTIDGPVAARILVPGLAGHPIQDDLKAEKDWTGEVGIVGRVVRELEVGLTGWGRFAFDQLDRQNVGTTNLVASYNFAQGRAAGGELSLRLRGIRFLDAFANAGLQLAQGQGISSENYLFTSEQRKDTSWVTLDHVQTWTGNVGFDLHDDSATTHLSGLVNYGSGLRTGATDELSVPEHTTLDLTLRHRFDLFLHPQVAIDVLNVFNDVYAYRIATGYIGSAYAPLRRINVRLSVPFGQ
jgi:outer membrane cobalamin receptor